MKVLFILGSHRKDGNTAQFVDIVKNHPMNNWFSPKFIWLADKEIKYCQSCYKCSTKMQCVLKDDVKEIVEEMKATDAIVYVPVIYAFAANSRFQAFLERVGYGFLRPQNRPLRNKLAIVVVIGRRYAHTSVASQVIMNILLNEMIIVGSGFLPLLYGQGKFPGNIGFDREGLESLYANIGRLIEWHNAKRVGICGNIVD